VTAAPLTEGNVDRSQAPNAGRLHAVAALAPHLPGCDPMWNVVVEWVSTHLDNDAQPCSSPSWREPASFAPRASCPTRTP